MKPEVEVLAPAGSLESLSAAINAGADAVYIGGSEFGARAFADNPNEEGMLRAIDHTHLYGKKLYLTVNTLLKDDEIKERLYNYIEPYYKEGLDAVIVQDLGVFAFIKENFPGMDIHASTQMTITSVSAATLMKKLGASRIVTARELSLEEIKKIHNNVDIEIESFVHGALCYCYSGQCLLSSIIGGRSGNRGRCAQPCRLPYDTAIKDKYILSPKDMCTIDILPQIIDAGVYSLKIEGRMKKPEYTALVVSKYRKYTDKVLNGEKYTVDKKDIADLMDIYNRGGFTTGYYERHNGKDMMSLTKPNHFGVEALNVIKAEKSKIDFKTITDISKGDVIEVLQKNGEPLSLTMSESVKKGSNGTAKLPLNKGIKVDSPLYRTRNAKLIKETAELYIENNLKLRPTIYITIKKDIPIECNIELNGTKVTFMGKTPDIAMNKPTSSEEIKKQVSKTGGTDYEFLSIQVTIDDGLFVTVGDIKELRRNALRLLEDRIINISRRN